jgi:hypothetical protein
MIPLHYDLIEPSIELLKEVFRIGPLSIRRCYHKSAAGILLLSVINSIPDTCLLQLKTKDQQPKSNQIHVSS